MAVLLVIIMVAVYFGFPKVNSDALDLQTPSFTIPYGTFQVPIYQAPDSQSFYYAPACTFVPNSTYVKFYGNHSLKNFVSFSVQFWDAKYHDYIETRVSEELQKNTTRSNLKLIPFQSVRFDSTDTLTDHIIENKWTSILHQPAALPVRILCSTKNECTATKEALDDAYERSHILNRIEITFAAKKPMQIRKTLALSTTAIERSRLFGIIEQRLSSSMEVCMQETVLRRMVREIIDNVVEDHLTQDDFVSEDQMIISINRAIQLLKANTTSTVSFQEDDWNKTFWPEATGRPDEKIKNVNTLLGNGKGWVTAFLKPGSSVKALEGKSFAQEPQSHIDWSVITSQLEGTDDIIQWNGDAFVIKPLILFCLNLTASRVPDAVLGNVSVLVSVKHGNWTSGVNTPSTSSADEFLLPLDKDRERLQRTERELREVRDSVSNLLPVGTIIAYHSNNSLPLCWLYCNGTTFNSSLYPDLASVLHPNSTTPNLNGRVTMGVGATYSITVGETGGEASHVLTTSEMPFHNHGIFYTTNKEYSWTSTYSLHKDHMSLYYDNIFAKVQTDGQGGGQAHNNLPPFLTTSYIIRAC